MTKDIARPIIDELDHFQRHFRPGGGALTHMALRQIQSEPFVGYAVVEDAAGRQTELFICRHYIPDGLVPITANADFASYLSPLGKVVSRRPGDRHAYAVKHRLGFVLEEHDYHLLRKNEFRSRQEDGRWDGVESRMAWLGEGGNASVRSLRRLLEGKSEEPIGREAQIKVQLPDQAILDAAQDGVFRLPLNQKVRISGAPGTGKTTVLLKRLSQKTKFDFLSEAEQKLVSQAEWERGLNWMLFTPSDLLKAYLKEALAKELLPAGDDHVKVYGTFRMEILRELGFIRVGPSGFFKLAPLDPPMLKRQSGTEHIALTKAFGEFLAGRYAGAFRDAVRDFNESTRLTLGKLTDSNQQVLLKAFDLVAKAGEDLIAMREAQSRAVGYRRLNEAVGKVIKVIREVSALQDRSDAPTLVSVYREGRRLSDLLTRISLDEAEAALFPEISPLIRSLREGVKKLGEAVALSRLFELIPRSYQNFREEERNQSRFFASEAAKPISDRFISQPEQDVLLFHALEFVASLDDELSADMAGVPGPVRLLRARMKPLIAIDEATDFSPLEVACMERFASPKIRGVTLCGDLMQRITRQGLTRWEELDELSAGFEPCDLNVSYRQTSRLFAVAKDLYQNATGQTPSFRSAYPIRQEDPPPLCHKASAEMTVEAWLTDRVIEIFTLCGNHLPSIAVLVPTKQDVEPVHRALEASLREHSIEVDASLTGQNLGDSARVRVFPVECIKGLEFEAVFYVGLDRMADVHKDLIEKFFYVGLSRARNFLGVTFERQFPARLQCIAGHFEKRASFQPAG